MEGALLSAESGMVGACDGRVVRRGLGWCQKQRKWKWIILVAIRAQLHGTAWWCCCAFWVVECLREQCSALCSTMKMAACVAPVPVPVPVAVSQTLSDDQ